MTTLFTARKMQPGHDTISVMALHYGYRPSQLRDVIKQAGVEVIREDGLRGKLVSKARTTVWPDGATVDPATTRLTKDAIKAVSLWAFQQQAEKIESDN